MKPLNGKTNPCSSKTRRIFTNIKDSHTIRVEYGNDELLLRVQDKVSQAAACDGTILTTSARDQEIVPGTFPTF